MFHLKFIQCLLNAYMEDDLSANGTLYKHLVNFMSDRLVLELPHHYIFFGKFWSYGLNEENYRLNFCRHYLHLLLVKGIVLMINHNQNLASFETHLHYL